MFTNGATSASNGITYQRADSIRVVELLKAAPKTQSSEELIMFYANKLAGLPYVAQTLEVNAKEQLVVNLREMDCTTFVENVIALALTANNGGKTFDEFGKNLTLIRYRDGKLNGYASRNHYFSQWIDSNTGLGLVKEISGSASDKRGAYYPFVDRQTLACTYMSEHPDRYPMLKDDKAAQQLISTNEKKVNGKRVRYIPKRLVGKGKSELECIHDGDIIAIVTNKKGLDISHIGFAVWGKDGRLHLYNASSIHKKVILEPKTLETYMNEHPSQLGIRIIRPVLPQSTP